MWGSGEFQDFEWHGLIIIGAEGDGTRIGRVRMRPVRYALPRYLHAFVEQCVTPGSTIYTSEEEWDGYGDCAPEGYVHENLSDWQNWDLDEDLPGRRKYSEMQRVDWVAERLKRWLMGTHAGAVSQSHLRYYLDEFTFRFNARRGKDPWEALRASPAASGDHRATSVSWRRSPLAFGSPTRLTPTFCWGGLKQSALGSAHLQSDFR